jgi:hypothetical protein
MLLGRAKTTTTPANWFCNPWPTFVLFLFILIVAIACFFVVSSQKCTKNGEKQEGIDWMKGFPDEYPGQVCEAKVRAHLLDMVITSCKDKCAQDLGCVAFSYNVRNGDCFHFGSCNKTKSSPDHTTFSRHKIDYKKKLQKNLDV